MTHQAWQPRGTAAPDSLDWKKKALRRDLQTILGWCRQRSLPAVYSCNSDDVWPSVGHGHSSQWERDLRTGQNALLDRIHRSAIRSRPEGGRFEIMADGAYWVDSGRQFLAWTYVPPSPVVGSDKDPEADSVADLEVLKDRLAALQAQLAELTQPNLGKPSPKSIILVLEDDVTPEIEEFVLDQTESCYGDRRKMNRVRRGQSVEPPAWQEFLADYVDRVELDDGTLIRLLGNYESPASLLIREIAESHWDDIDC